MMRKMGFIAAVSILCLGLGSMSTQAQTVKSQSFFFQNTCNGLDQRSAVAPGFTGTIIGGDIEIFQNPTGGIMFGFGGTLQGAAQNIVVFAGPGQTHVTTIPGFAGFTGGGTLFTGGGFPVVAATQILFDLACTSGPWQAFFTVWYV